LELEAPITELESTNSADLSEATRKFRSEREHVESRNRQLESLLVRRRGLAQQLDNALNNARSERQAIDSELATVLAAGSSAGE
jgi:cell division protein ZapA (FtsZ GTPase activity inhibitor)